MERHPVNGWPLEIVERVEGRVRELGHRVGLPYLMVESTNRYRQFQVMNGDHKIGIPRSLIEIEKSVNFAIAIYDEAMVEGIDDGEPPF